jgi:hypothetical protein
VRFQTHDGGVHFPLWIFFARTIDRFEKDFELGRDAMLSDEATPRNKGKYSVFIVPWIHWALY